MSQSSLYTPFSIDSVRALSPLQILSHTPIFSVLVHSVKLMACQERGCGVRTQVSRARRRERPSQAVRTGHSEIWGLRLELEGGLAHFSLRLLIEILALMG